MNSWVSSEYTESLTALFKYLKTCHHLEWCMCVKVALSRLCFLRWSLHFRRRYKGLPFNGKVLNFKCINHWLFLCFSVSKNPVLHLKHTTMKNKKKIRKKNPVSPVKKIQSPLKNKLIGSPAKNMPATTGSPQKLIDGFLKQEGTAAQVLFNTNSFW